MHKFTVRDLLNNEYFSEFKVIAGHNGLDREISGMEIIDYEFYDDHLSGEKLPDTWYVKNSLIYTSFISVKDQPERILDILSYLVTRKTSALMFKTIFFETLPQAALDFANEHDYPIIAYGMEDGFLEVIVSIVYDELRKRSGQKYTEKRIEELLEADLKRSEVQVIYEEVFKNFSPPYQVFYILNGAKFNASHEIKNIGDKYDAHFFEYKRNYFLVTFPKDINKYQARNIINDIGYYSYFKLGYSDIHHHGTDLAYAFKKSYYAGRYALDNNEKCQAFENMGLAQLLYPYKNDYWIDHFVQSKLEILEEYDQKFDSDLIRTIDCFVENDHSFKETADRLYLHPNTVQYRVKKAKEILDLKENEYKLIFSILSLNKKIMLDKE